MRNIDFEKTTVEVEGGQVVSADVIVGADGMPKCSLSTFEDYT